MFNTKPEGRTCMIRLLHRLTTGAGRVGDSRPGAIKRALDSGGRRGSLGLDKAIVTAEGDSSRRADLASGRGGNYASGKWGQVAAAEWNECATRKPVRGCDLHCTLYPAPCP